MTTTCPTCNGRGLKHWHPHWDNGHTPCTTCAGTGKIEDTDMTDLHHPRTAGEAVHRDKAMTIGNADGHSGPALPAQDETWPNGIAAKAMLTHYAHEVRPYAEARGDSRGAVRHAALLTTARIFDEAWPSDGPEPAAQPAQRVKPLVWEDLGADYWCAPSPLFGSIRIEPWGDRGFQVLWSVPGICDRLIAGLFATVDDAKAAAQADFDRRVSSALEPAAQDGAEVERLREALTPSGATKAAYHGEFSFHEHYTDEDGNDASRRVYVPWTTVKEIMAAIKSRAHEQGGA